MNFKGLFCGVFGHKYYVIKEYSSEVRKIGCRRCDKMWGMNDRVKVLVEWDKDLEELDEKGMIL